MGAQIIQIRLKLSVVEQKFLKGIMRDLHDVIYDLFGYNHDN